MKRIILHTVVVYFVTGNIGAAMAQSQQSFPFKAKNGSHKSPMTPERKANEAEKYRLGMAAGAALDAQNYEEAEADARQSIALGQDSGLAREFLAEALYAQGKTEEAFQAYKDLWDVGEENSDLLLPYSLMLLKSGHWAQAVTVFNKATIFTGSSAIGGKEAFHSVYGHFSPSVPQPRQLAAAIHVAWGVADEQPSSPGRRPQDVKALQEYQQAIILQPNSPVAHLFYGHWMLKKHRLSEARAAFAKAAQFGPGDVKAAAEKALER